MITFDAHKAGKRFGILSKTNVHLNTKTGDLYTTKPPDNASLKLFLTVDDIQTIQLENQTSTSTKITFITTSTATTRILVINNPSNVTILLNHLSKHNIAIPNESNTTTTTPSAPSLNPSSKTSSSTTRKHPTSSTFDDWVEDHNDSNYQNQSFPFNSDDDDGNNNNNNDDDLDDDHSQWKNIFSKTSRTPLHTTLNQMMVTPEAPPMTDMLVYETKRWIYIFGCSDEAVLNGTGIGLAQKNSGFNEQEEKNPKIKKEQTTKQSNIKNNQDTKYNFLKISRRDDLNDDLQTTPKQTLVDLITIDNYVYTKKEARNLLATLAEIGKSKKAKEERASIAYTR
jgi:hypothetical protein